MKRAGRPDLVEIAVRAHEGGLRFERVKLPGASRLYDARAL